MWRSGSSRPLVVHSPSHGMNTCEPKKTQFMALHEKLTLVTGIDCLW
jgi:hypothetical protein